MVGEPEMAAQAALASEMGGAGQCSLIYLSQSPQLVLLLLLLNAVPASWRLLPRFNKCKC